MSSISSCQVSLSQLVVVLEGIGLEMGSAGLFEEFSCFFSTSDLFAFWLECSSYSVSPGFQLANREFQCFEEEISLNFVMKMSYYFGGLLVQLYLQWGLESGPCYTEAVGQ